MSEVFVFLCVFFLCVCHCGGLNSETAAVEAAGLLGLTIRGGEALLLEAPSECSVNCEFFSIILTTWRMLEWLRVDRHSQVNPVSYSLSIWIFSQ